MTIQDLLEGGLVKVSQAARRLAMDRNTLYSWMRQGKMPYTLINGTYRIPLRAIEEMLARGLHVIDPQDTD
jgi:excisionase family DNA binding protein